MDIAQKIRYLNTVLNTIFLLYSFISYAYVDEMMKTIKQLWEIFSTLLGERIDV